MSFVFITGELELTHTEKCVSDSSWNKFTVPQIYGLDEGHRAVDWGFRQRVGPCSRSAFLGDISVEARGHGGRPLRPWGHLVEAPLFKTSPDTHPVVWVQSEDSQQRRGGAEDGRGGRNAAGVAAVTRRCLCPVYIHVCLYVHHMNQMSLGEWALFFCIMFSFNEFVFSLLTLSSSRGQWIW